MAEKAQAAWIVYQGGPRWDGEKWINGRKYVLSGRGKLNYGVELSPGVSGLNRAASEYKSDTTANIPGAVFVTELANKREIKAAINILGDTPEEFRKFTAEWERNNRTANPGRLYLVNKGSEPRYLTVRPSENANLGTHDKDPSLIRGVKEWDWGWESDDAYFSGLKRDYELKPGSLGEFSRTFYNPSTAPVVFPTLILPGGCSWTIRNFDEIGDRSTVRIESGEEARLYANPGKPTFLKKDVSGEIVNLWPTLAGRRPKIALEPETRNKIELQAFGGTPDAAPRIVFTPLFQSWV